MDNREVKWKLTLPLEKSTREDGWYIRGIASGTEPDLEADAFTPKCITNFANQINERPVPLNDWHNNNTIMAEMGQVEKAWLEGGHQLGVEIRLDQDHPSAQYLWKKLEEGKQYGLSVEGGAVKYEYNPVRKSKSGRMGRDIDDAQLSFVAVTTKPIYTPSFGTVLRKAIDEAESASVEQKGDTTSMDDVTLTTGNEAVETPTPEQTAAAPASASVEETPVVEKAVSADTARDAKKLTKLVRMHQDMAALISELGLDGGEIANPTVSEPEVEKSAKTDDVATSSLDVDAIKKAVSEATAGLVAELEALKTRIPEVTAPGVLISKSEADEAQEFINDMLRDPKFALRASLAARHGELGKFNG